MKKRIAIAALAVVGMASSALALSGADDQRNGPRAALTYGVGPLLGDSYSWTMAPATVWGPLSSIVAA